MDEEDVATCHGAEEAVSFFLVTLCVSSLLRTLGRFQPEVTQVKSHSCDGNQMLAHNTWRFFSPLSGYIALKGKSSAQNLHGWIKVSQWHNMAAVAALWGSVVCTSDSHCEARGCESSLWGIRTGRRMLNITGNCRGKEWVGKQRFRQEDHFKNRLYMQGYGRPRLERIANELCRSQMLWPWCTRKWGMSQMCTRPKNAAIALNTI